MVPPARESKRNNIPDPGDFVGFWFVASVLGFLVIAYLCLWICHRRITRTMPNYHRTPTTADIELPSIIHSIPHITYAPNTVLPYQEETCAVCLSEFVAGESVSTIPNCRHTFHSHCIALHMPHSISCPCCRRTVSVHDQHHSKKPPPLLLILMCSIY